jgi:hypothetical protein
LNAPREVKIAIILSWSVLAIETAERLWRISVDPDARTFTRIGIIWTAVTLFSAVIVALAVFFAARRRNWARVTLLVLTLGAWCLWFLWPNTVAEYAWWQWLANGTLTAMELAALVLLFYGKGALWYRSAPVHTNGSL